MTERCQPVNDDPPYIPDAEIYDTHRPGEWIAITDTVYADVVNGAWIEGYHLSFVALDTGTLWVHIESDWEQKPAEKPRAPADGAAECNHCGKWTDRYSDECQRCGEVWHD